MLCSQWLFLKAKVIIAKAVCVFLNKKKLIEEGKKTADGDPEIELYKLPDLISA